MLCLGGRACMWYGVRVEKWSFALVFNDLCVVTQECLSTHTTNTHFISMNIIVNLHLVFLG